MRSQQLQAVEALKDLRAMRGRPVWRRLMLVMWILSSPPAAADAITLRGDTMGTSYRVSVRSAQLAEAALQAGVDNALDAVNASMSTWRADSELSRLNQHPGTDWQAVSADLYTVLQAAEAVSVDTQGAFDVTVGPVVNLWGFGPDSRPPVPPDAATLAAARARVGHAQLVLSPAPRRVRKARADLYVDLSAIAKGYAVDRVAEWLEATGHTDYMVEFGGEIRTRGFNPRGQRWRIGIAWPVAGTDDIERVLPPGDTGLATSGDYRRYFEYGGVRYSHEIDPATGAPITHALASVTVLHPSCMYADAYATGLLVLGPTRGPALARKLGLSVLFLVREGDGLAAIRTGKFPAGERAR